MRAGNSNAQWPIQMQLIQSLGTALAWFNAAVTETPFLIRDFGGGRS